MSRILRPAYGLSRFEFSRAKDSARSFTTSQFFAAEDDARPGFDQRSERMLDEISSLLDKSSQRSGTPSQRAAPAAARGGPRKVVSLQSLPRRGARGGGGGGGLGIFRGLGRGAPGGGLRGGGTFRGRSRDGGARGRSGGARGGRGSTKRKKSDDPDRQSEEDFAARREAKSQASKEPETLEERQARIEKEVGVETRYEPSTTLASLVPFLPDVATDSNPLGRLATAMTNMRVLAGGHVDPNPIIDAGYMYRQYKTDGTMFFTDLRARKALEGKGEVGAVDDAVRNTITKRAVMGEYDSVQTPEAKDVAGVARSALRKEGSYQGTKVEAFEGKLAELVAKASARQGKTERQPKRHGKAEQPKGKGKGEKVKT